ncbi:MAG: DUF4062 domain-containing protein [Bryobacterales bacterium]|nr:DUF4062 domain-containing protein [Bryobacterales bacterium]
MHRVFLSSTFLGLEDVRKAAFEAINALSGYHCVRMEDFGASANPPIEVCLAELRTCEIYVGILGHLYGSCPPGETRSYTELEFQEASRIGMPQLLFLTSEDFPVPAKAIEDDVRRKRQQTFRMDVSQKLTHTRLHSHQEVRARVGEALTNHRGKWVKGGEPGTVLLFPHVTNQVGFDTGIAVTNASAMPFGGGGQAGRCRIHYYGRTSIGQGSAGEFGPDSYETSPVTTLSQYSEVLAPGDQLVFVLSGGNSKRNILATPGFQGYIVVTCEFSGGRGFAFLTDGPVGQARLATGYLAEVVPVETRLQVVAGAGR